MVDEEPVRLVVGFAVAAEHRAHGLGFLARVGEDEALATARALEDVADAGVGVFRRAVGGCEELGFCVRTLGIHANPSRCRPFIFGRALRMFVFGSV